MEMNRRAFLRTLSGSTVALVLDPERLLWVPGARTIFLPPPKRYLTADEIITETILEVRAILERNYNYERWLSDTSAVSCNLASIPSKSIKVGGELPRPSKPFLGLKAI